MVISAATLASSSPAYAGKLNPIERCGLAFPVYESVFADHGVVKSGRFSNTNDAVGYVGVTESDTSNVDDEHKPSLIGYEFGSARIVGRRFRSAESATFNFNGEPAGLNCQVDVERSARKLLDNFIAFLHKGVAKFILKVAATCCFKVVALSAFDFDLKAVFHSASGSVSGGDLSFPCFISGMRPLSKLGFALVADVNSGIDKASSDRAPVHVVGLGDLVFGLSGFIPADDLTYIQCSH